jgi:GWxTD domain-containing protein
MKMMWIFCLALLIPLTGYADLNMHLQTNRFLDENFNTVYEIVYEIPHKSMKFVPTDYGYGAQVDVEYVIKKDAQQHPGNFTNNIIFTDFYKTVSDDSYLDKIVITLSKPGYEIEIKFIDVLNKTEKIWNFPFTQLNADALMSDVELSKNVVPDTTGYMEKFHRKGNLYFVNTSNIFDQNKDATLYLYYELYSFFGEMTGKEHIRVFQKDKMLTETATDVSLQSSIKPVIREIPIGDYEPGLYRLEVEMQSGTTVNKREIDFSIKKDEIKIVRFFEDDEKDYEFVKLFLNSNEKSTFNNLDFQSKLFFIDRFWRTKEAEWNAEGKIVSLILDRLAYVNKHFGSQKTEGWQTDRGRIYLKYGEPDEIVKLNTNMYDTDIMQDNPQVVYTKLGAKDFHIWKYRSAPRTSYIFIDSYNNRLFRLIYSGDDDTEITNPSWKSMVGGDSFDENSLN